MKASPNGATGECQENGYQRKEPTQKKGCSPAACAVIEIIALSTGTLDTDRLHGGRIKHVASNPPDEDSERRTESPPAWTRTDKEEQQSDADRHEKTRPSCKLPLLLDGHGSAFTVRVATSSSSTAGMEGRIQTGASPPLNGESCSPLAQVSTSIHLRSVTR